MARKETQSLGSIPLQTLQAHVDYGYAVSRTTYGTIGVKVWVYWGPYGEESEVMERPERTGRPPARRGRR
jgi:small subunit ribosomal protein S3